MLLLPRNWVSVEVWGKPRQYGMAVFTAMAHVGFAAVACRPTLYSLGMRPPLMLCALLRLYTLVNVYQAVKHRIYRWRSLRISPFTWTQVGERQAAPVEGTVQLETGRIRANPACFRVGKVRDLSAVDQQEELTPELRSTCEPIYQRLTNRNN